VKKPFLKAEMELVEAIKDKVAQSIIEELKKEGKFVELLEKIVKKEIDPASAAEKFLREKFGKA